MKRKPFLFALVAMLWSFSFSAYAQETVVVNSFSELKAEVEKTVVARSNAMRTSAVTNQGNLDGLYGNVQLGNDIVMTDVLVIPDLRELTLDLNGHTISGDAGKNIKNLGSFTISDNSEAKTGGISCAIYNGGEGYENAFLDIKGGTFKNQDNSAGSAVITNYALSEIYGGRFFSENIALINHSSMVIDGGSSENVYIEGKNHYITNDGTLTVKNATIAGTKDAYEGDPSDFDNTVVFYNVAVNGVGYSSLSAAVAEAADGDLIRLFGDITESEVVTVNKAVTIDGNGKTFTTTADNAIKVDAATGTVVITDITVEGAGNYALEAVTAVNVTESELMGGGAVKAQNCQVFIQNTALVGTAQMDVVSVADDVTFNLEGGSITSQAQDGDENFFIIGGDCSGATFSIMTTNIQLGGADNYLNLDTEANTVKVHSTFAAAFNEKGYATETKGNFMYVHNAVARVNGTNYTTLAAALDAASNGDTVELLWADYKAPIAMNGTVAGDKTVTITGTADVDWSKGFLFVGRGATGNGKLIFDNANLTSVSNSSSTGFNVSGSEAGNDETNDGEMEIKNSTIVLDYMINKGKISLDNSTLTVKNGFSVTGREASESATGEDATATMTLANNSKVVVNNMNGMGIGHEAYGVMNIDATSTFETTQSFLVTANGTMNVNGGTVKIVGTLTNNGTVYATGAANLDAKVTGAGWFYMNGVNLDADTKLDGAKVAFINGENTVKGSVIKNGWFSVGVGQNAAAETTAAFAQAKGITLGDVTVNVSDNATIYTETGDAYSGWVGSAYSADKTQNTYTLNITNSLARFGYMHVSKDGVLNATGHSENKYEYAGNTVDFYVGDFINNGVVTLDGVDAWAQRTKISVDHADAVLNTTNGTKYMSNCTTGNVDDKTFLYYKAGTVNVDATSSVNIEKATTFVAGANLNIAGNVTAKGAVTGNGTITLTDAAAVYTAPADLTVGTNIENKMVVYNEGAYKVYNPAAKIGEVFYLTLQEAINAAANGDVITLVNDVTEDVVVTQAPDVKITIDGANKTMKGTITVDGKSKRYETAGLTIKNVNFDATAGIKYDACVRLGDGTTEATTNATRYTNNVTVEGCTFTDNDYSTVAIKSYTGGDWNLQIIDCTAEGMHSLAQLDNIEQGLVISGNTANTKNGINLNNTYAATIENNTINVKGYAVRAGVNGSTGGNITLTDNTLKTDNTEGDPAIELRGTVVALNMTKNVVSGDVHIKGTATTIAVDANYWDGKANPVVAEGSPEIKVNSYYSDEACDNLVRNHFGGSIVGYTTDYRIWGDAWGNAFESYVVKVIDADGNVMGETSLNNVDGIINGDVKVTWGINFVGESNDPYWTWSWTTRPSITNMPAKVQLWIDGAQVGEGPVQLNAPDNLKKIVAAVTDAEGQLISCHTSVANAADVTNATNIALLSNTTEEFILPVGVEFNYNGFTADNVKKSVALIGTQRFASLQDAVNAVKNGEEIVLVADCDEAVTFTQTSDVSFVLNGNDKTMTGSINITARAGKDATSTLVIKDFNFKTDETAYDFIKSVATNYYPNNITIQNCTFEGPAGNDGVVAVRLKSANNITIKDCTGKNLHSFLQNTAGWNLTIDNVTVDGAAEGGFALGTVQGVTVKNSTIKAGRYGIRLDGGYNNNAVIADNEIEAFIPVVVRYASVDGTLTFNGTNEFNQTNSDGYWCVIGTTEYKVNGELPTAATAKIEVTLNDTGLSLDGVYGNFGVASIGKANFLTFAEALDAVQDGETIVLTGGESNAELETEIDFTKDIAFTIKGNAPKYALPVVTFQNAEVTIKDATILIPELDARQNATINVVNSTVYDAGGNGIVKSYFNGAINIDATSTVYTMQVTTMGYINVAGTLNATWQTNVYGNGMITVSSGATFNTAALHLTGQDYSGRDNTAADRVGKPATIVVDGATLNVGKVLSANGADYSYNSAKGINVGTIDGKSAILDIKNGANVNIYMANGETANIGADGTVNVDASTLNVAVRGEGAVTLANAGTVNVTGASTLNIPTLTGNALNITDATLANVQVGGAVNAFGTNNISGTSAIGGMLSLGYNVDATEPIVVNITGNFTGANVVVGQKTSSVDHVLNVGVANGERTTAYFGQLGVNTEANIANAVVTYEYSFVRKNFNVVNSALENKFANTYMSLNAKVVLDNSSWKLGSYANIGSYGGGSYGNADVTLKNGSTMTATNLGIERSGDYVVKVAIDETSSLTATNLTNQGEMNVAGTVTASTKLANTGTINFTSLQAKVVTPTTGLTINHNFEENYKIVYKDGAYSFGDFVAEINGTYYDDIQTALKALTEGATLKFLNDVTVSEAWDCRYTGGLIAVPNVTIDGNGKTFKLTGDVEDKNWNAVFRVAANNVTFKNLTIDVSEAEKVQRGIAASLSITVENCKFIGNGTTSRYGVIYGEGAEDAIGTVVATITGSEFVNFSYGVSDNRNGQDAKSATVSGNVFTNSKVLLSAAENVTFNDNEVVGGGVNITSYTNASNVVVNAKDNTLDAAQVNQITTNPERQNVQGGFAIPVATSNNVYYLTLPGAIEAVAADAEITMLTDVTGAGAVINKNVTINFNGKTYTFNKGVGSSANTESNGLQILQGNTVTLKNGTLNVAEEAKATFYTVIQNYANLTVEDMTLDGTNLDKWATTDGDSYVLSINSGNVVIKGNTNITANNDGDKAFAFDACKYQNYEAPVVTVETSGTIKGLIESTATIIIMDGTYTMDVTKWCAEGVTAEPVEVDGKLVYTIVRGITIIDGQLTEFTNDQDKENCYIRYERTMPAAGNWYPLYVPFEIPVETLTALGYEAAYLYDVHSQVISDYEVNPSKIESIHLVKITTGTLRANYPYVIRATETADLELVLEFNSATLFSTKEMNSVESSTTTTRYIFAGTYTKANRATLTGDVNAPCYAVYSDGKWYPMDATETLGAFRVFMYIVNKDGSPFIVSGEAAQSIKMRVIGEENEDGTTTIYDVEADEQSVDYIYDLQGRRVLEPQKGGLYIVNGKKVIF